MFLKHNLFVILISVGLCAIAGRIAAGSAVDDEVHNLPGVDFAINYRQYYGYLEATDGRFLHYWFFESQRNATDDPLVLWFNGCTSLVGALTEQGPLLVKPDGTGLYANEGAWNREANLLFIEGPAGVGFSYKKDGNYTTDDDESVANTYAALQVFYRRFPAVADSDLYVAGESYASLTVPLLSSVIAGHIRANRTDIKLRAFALGNGWWDWDAPYDAQIPYAYYHGLIDSALWAELLANCCAPGGGADRCDFKGEASRNAKCKAPVKRATDLINTPRLNTYNIYADCHNVTDPSHPVCFDERPLESWINQPDVRRALHIPDQVHRWHAFQTFKVTDPTYVTMRPQYRDLLRWTAPDGRPFKVLHYAGDVDIMAPFLGIQWFVEDMTAELSLLVHSEYKAWYYTGPAGVGDRQVGGYYKAYERLAFVTIRGAGHNAPADRSVPSMLMINAFINSTANEFVL